jgi:hypothetical protein
MIQLIIYESRRRPVKFASMEIQANRLWVARVGDVEVGQAILTRVRYRKSTP